jgi:hypothetical protein
MDDTFISAPGERTPVTITGREPHSTGNGAAPPRRRSLRRKSVASRQKQQFDALVFDDPVEHLDFGIACQNRDDFIERVNQVADDDIGFGCEVALELLDRRIADGDSELLAVKNAVQRCLSLLSAMPPLSHVDSAPLRPDDRLYEFFDQFLSLLRQQESQMQELQTMINELI